MSAPVYSGGIELRDAGDGSRRLLAAFPYNSLATIHAGGNGARPRKEQFAPQAFSYAIDEPERDINLLVGHDFGKPLASKRAGTLLFNDTPEALLFEAIITGEIMEASWWKDFFAAFNAGLMMGISPGFRIPPKEAVAKAEEITEENPKDGKALIRTIFEAILFELSLVTRPAYPDTSLDIRQTDSGLIMPKKPAQYRWR